MKTVISLLLEIATLPALQPLPAYVMPSMYTLLRSMVGVSGPGRGEETASAAQRPRAMAGIENLMVNASKKITVRIRKRVFGRDLEEEQGVGEEYGVRGGE